ncbi:hypothetical protein [Estrella lausannensis]|uniref:Putative cytidylyltransferase n=1 Tax=Estrella lausannensis TaxID=483423 RepID=A0A0H5E3V4_9BACT|nr:hypothetical protein [Estrella lausannensis]CRX37895.1 Putative cytidylyltransferase [Estrella lausannensis]
MTLGSSLDAGNAKSYGIFNHEIPECRAVKADLYTSIAGNPVHKGHMGMIAVAIEGLKKQHIEVENVYVSLSYESYLAHKVKSENIKIRRENQTREIKLPLKVWLERDTRVKFLREAIKESVDKFNGVRVIYWDDQEDGESDHPESYAALVQELTDRRIVFLCGTDLCESMQNWGGKEGCIQHAAIITRANESPAIEEIHTDSYSRFIFEGAAEYQHYSSSAIQKERKFELLPTSVREEFARLHAEAQL